MLACELTSLPRYKSTRNWSYYSPNKRSRVCLCRDSENYTRPFIRICRWCAFHEKRRCFLCWTRQSRATAIHGKSMRIQYANQWLPRVSVFLRVSLAAGIGDRQLLFHCERYISQAHPSSIRLHEMLIVTYFQVKLVGILIRRGRAYFLIIPHHLISRKVIREMKSLSTRDLNLTEIQESESKNAGLLVRDTGRT